MKGGRQSSLRGPILRGFMEMKLGICLLLVCEIPSGEMLVAEGGRGGRGWAKAVSETRMPREPEPAAPLPTAPAESQRPSASWALCHPQSTPHSWSRNMRLRSARPPVRPPHLEQSGRQEPE